MEYARHSQCILGNLYVRDEHHVGPRPSARHFTQSISLCILVVTKQALTVFPFSMASFWLRVRGFSYIMIGHKFSFRVLIDGYGTGINRHADKRNGVSFFRL